MGDETTREDAAAWHRQAEETNQEAADALGDSVIGNKYAEVAEMHRLAADAIEAIAAATERAEKAEAQLAAVQATLARTREALNACNELRERVEARAKRLADLLAEAGSVLLDNAAVLHRHVLTTGSEKSNRAANRARAVAARIAGVLKETPE